MPVLEVTDEQLYQLLTQLTPERRESLFHRAATETNGADTPSDTPLETRPRPVFGSARGEILYMAEDFDAPLEDFKEYME